MIDSAIFQILLGEFQAKLAHAKNWVTRDAQFPDAPNKIKIAIGMRRTGKTVFLFQQILKLIDSNQP